MKPLNVHTSFATNSLSKETRLSFRWLNKLYANLFGYFWLPCPICGKDFGGHEWLLEDMVMVTWVDGKGVCPRCGEEAKRRNLEYMASYLQQATIKDK